MLQGVCFDLMDTVLRDPYQEAIQAATGMGLEEVHPHRDPTAWREFELAKIDEAEFARRFYRDGTTFDITTFHRVRRAGYRWVPGMRELVDDLRGIVNRYLATNYPVWVEELRLRFALDARFEGIWASHHLGVRKPDPAFYTRLLDEAAMEPERCLFVDDRPGNCEAAEAVGMRTHVFHDAAGLRARLVAEGVLGR